MQISTMTASGITSTAFSGRMRPSRTPVIIDAEVIRSDKQAVKPQSDVPSFPLIHTLSIKDNAVEKNDIIETAKPLPTAVSYYLQIQNLSSHAAKHIFDETI